MKKLLSILSIAFVLSLTACGGGDSDSGGPTTPGSNIPQAFIGVYQGTLNLRGTALGITARDSFPITITVNSDGTLRFDGDEPNETVTVGLTNDGRFNGSLDIVEDECSGTITINGQVNAAGTNASGSVEGNGVCTIEGTRADVELAGDFSANK